MDSILYFYNIIYLDLNDSKQSLVSKYILMNIKILKTFYGRKYKYNKHLKVS